MSGLYGKFAAYFGSMQLGSYNVRRHLMDS